MRGRPTPASPQPPSPLELLAGCRGSVRRRTSPSPSTSTTSRPPPRSAIGQVVSRRCAVGSRHPPARVRRQDHPDRARFELRTPRRRPLRTLGQPRDAPRPQRPRQRLRCVRRTADPLRRPPHPISWIDDGPTALTNLVLLCRRHHIDLHARPLDHHHHPRHRPRLPPRLGRPTPTHHSPPRSTAGMCRLLSRRSPAEHRRSSPPRLGRRARLGGRRSPRVLG